MKLNRVYAIILRNLYTFRHSFDRLTDAFYWPTIDLILWGITSMYFTRYSTNIPQITLLMLSGVLLWIIVWRGQAEISMGILDDLWNRNLINVFASPIKFSEWIMALVTLGVIKSILSFSFALFIAYILYAINILPYAFYLIPFSILLIMTGWSIGFFITALIMRFGTRIQTFAWTVPWVISPFSAIYYPVAILPNWAQKISGILPTSYIFEGMREVINTGNLDPLKIYISLALNVIYLILSIYCLKSSFNKLMKRGLNQIF
jgi:ABC-2 type transport system permease protein